MIAFNSKRSTLISAFIMEKTLGPLAAPISTRLSLQNSGRFHSFCKSQSPFGSIGSLTIIFGWHIGEWGFLMPPTLGIQLQLHTEILSPFPVIHPIFLLISLTLQEILFRTTGYLFYILASHRVLLVQYLAFRILVHNRLRLERYFQHVRVNLALLLLFESLILSPQIL